MPKLILKTAGLFAVSCLIYLLHRYVFLPLFNDDSLEFLNFSYGYNLIASIFIIASLLVMSLVSKEFLGFIFLLFGGVKLVLFIFLVKKYGFELNKALFLHFFIPYLLGVLIEIYFVITLLKDYKPNEIN